jgi:hypothetical protein
LERDMSAERERVSASTVCLDHAQTAQIDHLIQQHSLTGNQLLSCILAVITDNLELVEPIDFISIAKLFTDLAYRFAEKTRQDPILETFECGAGI